MVTRFCEEAIWLDQRTYPHQGSPQQVIDAYMAAVAQNERRGTSGPARPKDRGHRRRADLQRRRAKPTTMFASGDPIRSPSPCPRAGAAEECGRRISIFNSDGVRCCATNRWSTDTAPFTVQGEATSDARWIGSTSWQERIPSISWSTAQTHPADQDHRTLFTVTSSVRDIGVFRPPHTWSFTGTTPSAAPSPEEAR